MKRLLLIPFMLCALVLGAIPAHAGPPAEASGDWTYGLPGITGQRLAGPNVFLYGTGTSTLTGTFEGTSEDEFVVVCHQKGPESVNSFVNWTIEFTGEVNGREGTLAMKATGKQTSNTCDPSDAIWTGRWVIIGGTDELADLHGNGTWTGPSFELEYFGQIH